MCSEPDDLVWVHDYHLMPLAKALRERGHKNRIGFFLHIPCPPPEMLTALPHHERLIPPLCEYDLVGFQTGDDAFNFSRYLTRECGLHSHDFNFRVGERTMRIDVFPVGIETADFARLAQRSQRMPFVQNVLESLAGRALIIGVDRLDYSKGIAHRLCGIRAIPSDASRLARQGDLSADRAEEPRRDPGICRHGARDQRSRGAHQRRLWRGGLDADPLRQPRL